MPLEIEVKVCDQCFKNIKDRFLANIWEKLCIHKGVYKKDFIIPSDEGVETIQLLEKKGYAVSLDHEDTQIVRPLGQKENNGYCHFCIDPHNHCRD